MNETWYRILRRLFDLIILLLFVVILLPDQWYRKSPPVVDRPFERTESMVKHLDLTPEAQEEAPESATAGIAPPVSKMTTPESVVSSETAPILSPESAQNSSLAPVPTDAPEDQTIIDPEQITPVLPLETPVVEAIDVPEGSLSLKPEPKAAQVKATEMKNDKVALDAKPVYWFQVGVFQNKTGAETYLNKLKQAKLPYRAEVLGKLTVLKVGPVSEGDITRTTNKLKDVGISTWVKTRQSK